MTVRRLAVAFRASSFVTALALAASLAAAQFVPLSGNVSDGAGGPLLPGTVYHAVSPLAVPAGTTLTVQPGAILKFAPSTNMEVHGTLHVAGVAGNESIFTSLADDAAGGDTNGDGPSSGTATQWPGIRLHAESDASVLERLVLRYAGSFGWNGIILQQSDATLRDCTIASTGGSALDLSNNSLPTVTGCSFVSNWFYAVTRVPLDAVPGFEGNAASGNGLGDYLRIEVASPSASRTITKENQINGALVITNAATVSAGSTLTLEAGVVLKMTPGTLTWEVHGLVVASGTEEEPVVLTSYADDEHGGDTNKDGPSTGAGGQWNGIRFHPSSDASVLDHLLVRHGGNFGWPPLVLAGADLTMRDCTVERSNESGLLLVSNARPSVSRCDFRDNWFYAVSGVTVDAIPGFAHNEASGNGLGDHMYVGGFGNGTSATIGISNLINGVIVLQNSLVVPASAALTLLPGVVVKFQAGPDNLVVDVHGRMDLRGSGARPIVFTTILDDEHAGDTNEDGLSVGGPYRWNGIRYNAGSGPSTVEHVLLRYGGNFGWPMFLNYSAQTTLRSIRAEHSGDRGIYLTNAVGPRVPNLVAFDCATDGIQLDGGSFDLTFATSVRNGGAGIRKTTNHAGIASNTIAWSNTGGNFVGFKHGGMYNSNGDPTLDGVDGNSMFPPGFADEAAGDLHLTTGSAMLDGADFFQGLNVGRDHEENSRVLDDDVNSAPVPDRGAYELAFWHMETVGEPRLGEKLYFTVQSYAGQSVYYWGRCDGVRMTPFGMLSAGSASLTRFANALVGTTIEFRIPNLPTLVGTEVGVQTITFPLSTTLFGNVTNLWRGFVLP